MNPGIRGMALLSLLLLVSLCFPEGKSERGPLHRSGRFEEPEKVHVGMVVDRSSTEGQTMERCFSMALSDFYSSHSEFRTRIVLDARDSRGEPLHALSAAMDLLQNERVEVILGAQSLLEAKILAELANKVRVPLISFHPPSTKSHPYVVQVAPDEASEVEGVAAFVDAFGWRGVILAYEDSDDWGEDVPRLVDTFHKKRIKVVHKAALTASLEEDEVIYQLKKIQGLHTTVFVVHLSPRLVSVLFSCARRLGMLGENTAWILTAKSTNLLHHVDYFVRESMQGVIGFRTYVPTSRELLNFTARWRRASMIEEPSLEEKELSVFGIWAHDIAWTLARAVEKARAEIPFTQNPERKVNLMNLGSANESTAAPVLLKAMLDTRFKGFSGEIQFIRGRLLSNTFEIVNLVGKAERRVGFSVSGSLTRELHQSVSRRYLASDHSHSLEPIIWPGESINAPKGRLGERTKKLRVVVPVINGFPELVKVQYDLKSNEVNATGFCIDVFETVIRSLPYQVDYQFVPGVNMTHNDLIYAVYNQKYDAAVGDISIQANRSVYVDFTIPFTDMGVGIVTREETDSNMWNFLQPFTADLWIASLAGFVICGFLVWLVERETNKAFQCKSASQNIGIMLWYGFSTSVFAQRERLNHNLSRFIVIVWVFAVLAVTSNYTANLSSMLTARHMSLELNKKNYIGYHVGSIAPDVLDNFNFTDATLRPLLTVDEIANGLSEGSKQRGVSAVVEEIPYIRILLARYPGEYVVTKVLSLSNGFGFVFPKGSPMVSDLSRGIAKLREDGRLQKKEAEWLLSEVRPDTYDDGDNSPAALSLYEFRGLFLCMGVAFAFHISWYLLSKLRAAKLETLKELNLHGSVLQKVESIKNRLIKTPADA